MVDCNSVNENSDGREGVVRVNRKKLNVMLEI